MVCNSHPKLLVYTKENNKHHDKHDDREINDFILIVSISKKSDKKIKKYHCGHPTLLKQWYSFKYETKLNWIKGLSQTPWISGQIPWV